ncbi:flavodoxin family protein [Actinoplanes sp. TBRC 11911]|uniref:flavodoxin family protein n=1 Tax=Actinoplanes sp. TBRC 11911 TaxID=2729386 RepID=UPI00145E2EAD|nr:flavodoxin family protein [Actinoplanes sp. TBRC 11911]NMO57278.1 flavodoxin family protein [Actinoplanes sp. TBRC 11911]
MKALVVYESMFGNTEKIARAIADGLGDVLEVTIAEARTMPSAAEYDLIVVGGPTHAFGLSRAATRQAAVEQGSSRPADAGLREYLDVSPMLTGVAAATFDTKVKQRFVPGSAASKAHRQLRRLGCRMLAAPQSFRVAGTPGPLLEGEVERARGWAAELGEAMKTERHRV